MRQADVCIWMYAYVTLVRETNASPEKRHEKRGYNDVLLCDEKCQFLSQKQPLLPDLSSEERRRACKQNFSINTINIKKRSTKIAKLLGAAERKTFKARPLLNQSIPAMLKQRYIYIYTAKPTGCVRKERLAASDRWTQNKGYYTDVKNRYRVNE